MKQIIKQCTIFFRIEFYIWKYMEKYKYPMKEESNSLLPVFIIMPLS